MEPLQQEICWYVKGHYGRTSSQIDDLKVIIADQCLLDKAHVGYFDVIDIVNEVFLICAEHNQRYYHSEVLKALYRPHFDYTKSPIENHIEVLCSLIRTTAIKYMPDMGTKGNFKFS